jgi:multicomponent Na+:H+ antiporter subunit F
MMTDGLTGLEAAANAALTMLAIAFVLAFIRLVRGPSLPDRVVALDLMMMLGIGVIAAIDVLTNEPVFLDVASAAALITFLGTVALARYVERGGTR